jgi:hypothetical protein
MPKLTEAEIDRLAAVEEANAPHTHARNLRMSGAAAEAGLAGELRRGIDVSRRDPADLAAAIGVDIWLLEQFRSGESTLPFPAVSRLVDELGLHLVPATAEASR